MTVAVTGIDAASTRHPAGAAAGPSTAQNQVVSSIPSTGTPQFVDGTVLAFAQVGQTMVAGGSFTQVQNYARTSTFNRSRIVAFDAAGGAISTSFSSGFNGEVDALLPGPTPGTVYAGGSFTTYNGTAVPNLVLLNVANGSRVATFAPGPITKAVTSIRLAGSRLIIGGQFTTVNGVGRGGLASLNPSTGALTSFLSTGVSGHHNYGNVPADELAAGPPGATVAQGRTGVSALAINPQGTRMVVIGNFTAVGGLHRDQIAVFNLTASAATPDPTWASTRYSDSCFWFAFDGYLRDVDFSPDGSYFTVAAAGGHDLVKPQSSVLCDTVARFETSGSGPNVEPTWSQSSGSDSFFSVAVTGTAVYAGGHPRWANNPLMSDGAGPGAVARPSLIGLDPLNGMPLKFNPGREPRGVGIQAMLATPAGLWLGYDTAYLGNRQYYRSRLAFLPLTGGYVPATGSTATLPATVYLPGAGTAVLKRSFNGTLSGPGQPATSPLTWSDVHGAMLIGRTLFYARSDSMLYSRSYDGSTYGPEQKANPYSDPLWDDVQDSGRGTNGVVYLKGVQPDLYAQFSRVTAMAFSPATHRLYYTLNGDPALYYRAFSPDSAATFPIATAVTGVSMAATNGLVLSGSTLWFSNRTTGALSRVGLSAAGFNGPVGTVSGPAIDGISWSAGILFTAAS